MNPIDSTRFEPPGRPWRFSPAQEIAVAEFQNAHPELANWSREAIQVAWVVFSNAVGRHTQTALPVGRCQAFLSFVSADVLPAVLGPSELASSVRVSARQRAKYQMCIDRSPPKKPAVPFNNARAFARKLGLKSAAEWTAYCAGMMSHLPGLPEGIPVTPAKVAVYRTQWKGWNDFLGYSSSPAEVRAIIQNWAQEFARVNGRPPIIERVAGFIWTRGEPGTASLKWTPEEMAKAAKVLMRYPSITAGPRHERE